MHDEKTEEREPMGPDVITGREALIREIDRACGPLNKLAELQLNEPLLCVVAVEIRAHMNHLGASLQALTEPCC
ncbi:MAG: hypothetical protein ACXV3D_03125 [Halobacteriota archaeon]